MIEYVANLSRIELDSEQFELMQTELDKILKYMEVLKTVDTTGIEPMSHIFSEKNITRPDVVTGHFERALLLQNAPESTEEAFIVPKAVDA